MSKYFTYEQTNEGGLLKFQNNATIQNIDEIYQSIKRTIKKNHQLTIEIGEVSSIDVSFIQLIIAIKKSLDKENKKCIVKGSFGLADQQLMHVAGLNINDSILKSE